MTTMTAMATTLTAKDIAIAFCKADQRVGRSFMCEQHETVESRADNLVRCGYIRLGDPGEWCSPDSKPVATIYAEQKGGEDDCIPPIEYYGRRWVELGHFLPGYYWEWNNPAVAHLWRI